MSQPRITTPWEFGARYHWFPPSPGALQSLNPHSPTLRMEPDGKIVAMRWPLGSHTVPPALSGLKELLTETSWSHRRLPRWLIVDPAYTQK